MQKGKDVEPTRAAQIARGLSQRMKALGQLPEVAEPKKLDRETPEQLQRRSELKKKLKSFWE